MKQYLELAQDIINNGEVRTDRTGTGTKSIFGAQMRFDLRKGFPAITTKKMFFKGIIGELLFFLAGNTHLKDLWKNNIHIWDLNAWDYFKRSVKKDCLNSEYANISFDDFIQLVKDCEEGELWISADEGTRDFDYVYYPGDLGNIYSKQWREWSGFSDDDCCPMLVDQISDLIKQIKETPDSRRLLVTAWNPAEINYMALPPCHTMFQFYCGGDNLEYLDCQLYQRSGDFFLGVPFNITSYALLLAMVAQVTGKTPRYFVHTLGDAHIYLNHIDQMQEQILRKEMELPKLWLNPEVNDIFAFQMQDIKILDYQSHPAIKADMAV